MTVTRRLPRSVAADGGRRASPASPAALQLLSVRRARAQASAVAVAGMLAGVVAEGHLWVRHPLLTSVNLLASSAFAVTGWVLLKDREQRVTAWVLIFAGITLPLGWLDQWEVGPFPLYSVVFGYLSDVLGAWALLQYPEERLSRGHRRFCVLLASWLILGSLALAFLSRPTWWGGPFRVSVWWPTIWPDRSVFNTGQAVLDLGALAFAVSFVVLLVLRLTSGSRSSRVILLPVITAGIISAVAAALVVIVSALSSPGDELFVIEAAAELTVPIGFLVSITQQRLVQMTDLVTQLDNDSPTTSLLRQVLQVALRDPLLDLLTWSSADSTYRTVEGQVADAASLASGRSRHQINGWDGEPLALLIADPSSARDQGLMRTAVVLIRLTLDNAQLSRRLLTADYDARQRLASDLHDGVQNKLCGLLVALSTAQQSANSATRASLDRISLRANEALSELRDLAHGVYPDTLALLGLRAAIDDAAGRLDLPANVRTPAEALPAETQETLYFMICEALTNIYRHARASNVTVAVTRCGQMVEAVVTDDGGGGANPLGNGLGRMRDRAHAHGGALDIDSPPGHGTTLTMRIPCA